MMKFYLVDVKNITSDTPRSTFVEADLDNLADMILESGGVIRPLILKHVDLENYTVVDGHFEYYAAVRAREKDPRKGEMVNAFVISPKSEDTVLKQVVVFNEVESSSRQIQPLPEQTNLEARLTNLESYLTIQINSLKEEQVKERQTIEKKLTEIESKIPKKILPLETFNTLSVPELALRLTSAGMNDKTAAKIAKNIDKERQYKKFDSLIDVVERVKIPHGTKQKKAISSEKMVSIIDSWSHTLFI